VSEKERIEGICGSLQKQGLCLSKAFMRCEMQLLRCLSATIKFAKILFFAFSNSDLEEATVIKLKGCQLQNKRTNLAKK